MPFLGLTVLDQPEAHCRVRDVSGHRHDACAVARQRAGGLRERLNRSRADNQVISALREDARDHVRRTAARDVGRIAPT